MTRIERLGVAITDYNYEDFHHEPSPLDLPRTLLQVVLGRTNGRALRGVLTFFSKVSRVDTRPDVGSNDRILSTEPWTLLKRVNIRCRRAVLEYQTPDIVNTIPRMLNFFARRNQITNSLLAASAHSLTTLSLDEGAWDFLANESSWSKNHPILLPTLTTLRIALGNCVYFATKRTRNTETIGLFAQPDFLAALDMPCLNNLDLVHISSWTCRRVVSGRSTGQRPSQPCYCHNNGIIAMCQVVDLLRHLRGVAERRLPQLAVFGVKEVLDDESKRNARYLKQLVAKFALHVEVPKMYVDEDAEVNAFDGLVVRPRRDDRDFRYRF